MGRYTVFRLGRDGQRQAPLGEVELDGDNRLGVVEGAARADPALDRALADINGRDALTVRRPPGAGEPRFSIRKELVPRSDPGFLDAIQENLRRWHSMEMVAEPVPGEIGGG